MNNTTLDQPILLSIIIPFYNVENYISKCLESVYNQHISEEQYEVICVNDCSPDNSKRIVLEYQRIHKNLVLIEHVENKKLGVARNTGRSIANGKYIWNVDSDDYIKPDVLKYIIDICERDNLDVLVFNFDHYRNSEAKLNETYPFEDSDVFSGTDFINRYCIGNFHEISPVWTQVYRKAFLDDNNIFSPPINMGEDVPYTFKALLLAKRIKSVTASCYVYRLNEASLGGRIEVVPSAEKIYEKSFVCANYVYDLVHYISDSECRIKNEYLNLCRYILLLFWQYVRNMIYSELKIFQILCRRNFFKNKKLIALMGRKSKFKFFMFLLFNKV